MNILNKILCFACFGCVNQGKSHLKDVELTSSWFPVEVEEAFSGAWGWSQKHTSQKSASQGVQLIGVRRLTREVGQIHEANLNWSTDGAYLGYEKTQNGIRTVSLKSLNGIFKKNIAIQPVKKSFFQNHYGFKTWNSGLRWARDSNQYVFVSNGGSGQFDIYYGSIEDQDKALTQDRAKDGHASWNPSKEEVVYVSSKSGQGDIYLIKTKSKDIQRVTKTNHADLFPEWAPGGERIFYSSGPSNQHQLTVVERFNDVWETPRLITRWNVDVLRPTVSPDGSVIAFYAQSSHEAHQWNLHVIPWVPHRVWSDIEKDQTIVAKNVVVDLNTGPTWSPNGHNIFYVSHGVNGDDAIFVWDFVRSRRYKLSTETRENRDLRISKIGVLSFKAQEGAWDRVYLALTNQGNQIQKNRIYKKPWKKSQKNWRIAWREKLQFW
ncbi:MAG: TolB family protein [Oligoflexales bacterium]